MIQFISLLFYFLFPCVIIFLCRKYSFFNKIGEILVLYIVGILVSNLVVFPLGLGDKLKGVQDALTSVTILLAFPMILFGCDFRNWKLRKAITALCIGLVSVVFVDIIGFYIFNDEQTGFEKIAGLLVGVYTGGTPNLASLKIALNVDAETYIFITVSFFPFVRKMEKSYDAGMYLVLVFSLVVASMVDVTAIDYRAGANIIAYIAFVIFCSLVLSILLSKIFKVDSDTMVITSVALINSPLFVPMIAESMKNKKVIITGITVGVVGYAVGNYLGIIVSQLLK